MSPEIIYSCPCEYEDLSDRFLLSNRTSAKQFAWMYAYRLKEISKYLKEHAIAKWGEDIPILKLSDLKEDSPQKCIVIGTLFKHQIFKPSILRDLSEENQLIPQPARENYVDENDKIILEDELQRIRLTGKIDVHSIVTGVVCAVLGYVDTGGKFIVDDVLFHDSSPQQPLKSLQVQKQLVVFASDINFTSLQENIIPLEIFQQWLCGNMKINDAEKWDAKNIVRLIIAGNVISSKQDEEIGNHHKPNHQTNGHSNGGSKNVANDHTMFLMKNIKEFEKAMLGWCQCVPVDVMPGQTDPSNYMLPQQPFHPCMFQNASKMTNTFKCVPNPYICRLDGRLVLGSSGQNIQDIMKTSKIENHLDALRSTLKWGHIAPTCPDTLASYPYTDYDPFIIDEKPHLYFVGNCPSYATEMHEGENGQQTRLICVPSFRKTKSVVIVDLESLEAQVLNLNLSLDGMNCNSDSTTK